MVRLRLGIVMAGVGVHAAAHIGLLAELACRGMEPYAVCGMQAGAWPAALYCAGLDMEQMHKALLQTAAMGRRLADAPLFAGRRRDAHGGYILRGRRLEHLLRAQTGDRLLALCPRRGIFLCRGARTGRPVVFTSQLYRQDNGIMLSMQAGVGFAARAAMTMPPFLPPVEWMGSMMLPQTDLSFACRQLQEMGAQRVLVALPVPSHRKTPDALELAGLQTGCMWEQALPAGTGVLRSAMPDTAGAMQLDRIPDCERAGQEAARDGLDRVLEGMGMAFCRVLPFRRPDAGRSITG